MGVQKTDLGTYGSNEGENVSDLDQLTAPVNTIEVFVNWIKDFWFCFWNILFRINGN